MCEQVLLISDNDSHSHQLGDALQERLGYHVITTRNSEEALSKLITDDGVNPDLVLMDMGRSGDTGLALLQSMRMAKPHLPVILLVEQGSDRLMARAFEIGVNDILAKPFCLEQVRLSICNVTSLQRMSQYASYLERRHSGKLQFDDIIGRNRLLKDALQLACQAAITALPVWIGGEAGTGREMLATAIHSESTRSRSPLVVVDCRMLESGMQDLTLFGGKLDAQDSHVTPGKLLEASNGTIVLKHTNILHPDTQQRLQKVMLTGVFQQMGSQQPQNCAARFILIGTNTDTQPSMLKQFCGLDISLPPLRDRGEDISVLANYFVRRFSASENKPIRCISDSAMEHLKQQPWHGNVRELSQVLWRAVLMSHHECIEAGDIRLIQHMQPVHYENRQDSIANRINPLLMDTNGNMKDLEAIEKEVIQFALTYSGGCMTHAAKNLGIGRSTLYRRMHALKLNNYISRENQTTRPTMRMSSKVHS